MSRGILRLCFALFLLLGGVAFAEPQFPALSGRIVDQAHILSPDSVRSLTQMLEDYERGTSNQVVVVTVPSLQGYEIDDYGYQLGRAWGLGQKGKDNGALLVVAPTERKVRIEVGYGLEPILTDTASNAIIQGIILPAFKSGSMEAGVVEGTKAMLSVLGGKGIPAEAMRRSSPLGAIGSLIWIVLFFFFAIRHPFLAMLLLSGGSHRFGGSRHGGFSGGGGSFGGGGASGSW